MSYIIDHGTRTLLQVPDKQMDDFIRVMDLDPDALCEDDVQFIPGGRVRVIKGDLAGVEGEVYGIQIQQDWNSSTYGDRGYLFLVLDMNDADTTRIHVRTWQPHPDPVDGLFDLSKF